MADMGHPSRLRFQIPSGFHGGTDNFFPFTVGRESDGMAANAIQFLSETTSTTRGLEVTPHPSQTAKSCG